GGGGRPGSGGISCPHIVGHYCREPVLIHITATVDRTPQLVPQIIKEQIAGGQVGHEPVPDFLPVGFLSPDKWVLKSVLPRGDHPTVRPVSVGQFSHGLHRNHAHDPVHGGGDA